MSTPADAQKQQSPAFVPDFDRKSKIEEDFKVLKKYEDCRFGPVAIIEVPGNNKRLMVREKTFNNKNDMVEEIRAAHRRLALGDKHLLAFVDYSTGSRSDFCSTIYWIKLYFEFPDHDVDVELRRRTRENLIGFTSTELTHMLYQTIHAGAVLNRSELYHGDICPQTIEMDNPEFYKLVERFGELAHPEEFQQTRIMGGGDVYSAPEIYSRIKKGRGKTSIKGNLPAKAMMTADVFNLGMTILHAGTDEGVQGAYNADGTMNLEVLEKLKSHFTRKYPENTLLVTTVYAMLEQDPARRPPDFITMESELPPYAVISEALEYEKRNAQSQFGYRPHQPTAQGVSQAGPQAYNQYVNQASWEQNWGKNSQSARSTHQGASPLSTGLNLPKGNYQPPAPQTPQSQDKPASNFGVVPPMGQGVPGYTQPVQTSSTQQTAAPALQPSSHFGVVPPLGTRIVGQPTSGSVAQQTTGTSLAAGQSVRPIVGTTAVQGYTGSSVATKPAAYSQSGLVQPSSQSYAPTTGIHSTGTATGRPQGAPVSYVQGQQGTTAGAQGGLGARY